MTRHYFKFEYPDERIDNLSKGGIVGMLKEDMTNSLGGDSHALDSSLSRYETWLLLFTETPIEIVNTPSWINNAGSGFGLYTVSFTYDENAARNTAITLWSKCYLFDKFKTILCNDLKDYDKQTFIDTINKYYACGGESEYEVCIKSFWNYCFKYIEIMLNQSKTFEEAFKSDTQLGRFNLKASTCDNIEDIINKIIYLEE